MTETVTDLFGGGRLRRQDSATKEFVFCDLRKGEFHEFFTGEPSFTEFSKSGFPVKGLKSSSRDNQSRSAFSLFVLFLLFYFLFIFFFFFRVGKSLACHSPGKWCLCA